MITMEPSSAGNEREALGALRAASIPRLHADHWTPNGAKEGLVEIARLRASLAVAQAVLVGVMATERRARHHGGALPSHQNVWTRSP